MPYIFLGNYGKAEITTSTNFWKEIRIKKSRKPIKCYCCQKERAKGTKYISNRWTSICQYCFLSWISNSKEFIRLVGESISDVEKEYLSHEKEWGKTIIIEQLEKQNGRYKIT